MSHIALAGIVHIHVSVSHRACKRSLAIGCSHVAGAFKSIVINLSQKLISFVFGSINSGHSHRCSLGRRFRLMTGAECHFPIAEFKISHRHFPGIIAEITGSHCISVSHTGRLHFGDCIGHSRKQKRRHSQRSQKQYSFPFP